MEDINNKIELLDKIREVYERIQNEFLSMSPFGPMNTKEYRLQFKERLENEFIGSVVRCDETNNTPNIIDNHGLVARVSFPIPDSIGYKYLDLIFGTPDDVMKIQQEEY